MGRRDAGEGSIRKRQDGRYEARLSVGPRGRRRVLSGYGATKAEAWSALERRVEEYRRRMRLSDVAGWTVGAYLDWWIADELTERVADGSNVETTVKDYERQVRIRIKPALGDVPLVELSPADVRSWMADMRRQGVHDRVRQKSRAVLSAALADAVRYEYVDRNAAAVVAPPAVTYERRDEVPVDQARRLLEAAAGTRLEALWVLMLHIPLRPGEPTGSEWSQFDLDAGTYRVAQNLVRVGGDWRLHDLKGHRARTVPIPAAVADSLKAHRERQLLEASFDPGWQDPVIVDRAGVARPRDLVFRAPGGAAIWWSRLGEELERICSAAEVPRLTPHGLRHAATSLLQSRGTHPSVVQQLGGWSQGAMVDHYTAGLDDAMRQAVDGLAEWLS